MDQQQQQQQQQGAVEGSGEAVPRAKARRPYLLQKQREIWTAQEHQASGAGLSGDASRGAGSCEPKRACDFACMHTTHLPSSSSSSQAFVEAVSLYGRNWKSIEVRGGDVHADGEKGRDRR